jgi:apolipoprotein N-acyltransferase
MFDPALPRSRTFLPAILSGVLLYVAFFPVNAGFLGWIALVPLLSLVRANARPRRIYLATFVGGLFCYVPAIQWMRVAHPAMYASWLFLAVCCALFLVMSLWLTRKLDRVGVPLWLAVPIAFVSVEYFRSHFPTGYTWLEWFGQRNPIGFGWYLLGHTQHDWPALIQIADLTGVYGLSFLVAVVNTAIWLGLEQTGIVRDWLRQFQDRRPASVRPAFVAALLVVVAIVYGTVRLNHNPFPDGPHVALIQGNIPQDIKNDRGPQMEQEFIRLADEAVRQPAGVPNPDLVVWPETSFVIPWYDCAAGIDLPQSDYKYRITDPLAVPAPAQARYWQFRAGQNQTRPTFEVAADRWRTSTLFGLNTFQWEADERKWRYNSALLIDREGAPLGRYDKMHLVPFGEYVPAVETLPFMSRFTPYDQDYSCKPGSLWTRFPLTVGDRTYYFACVICYEDTDATLARQYVRPGEPGVDFFVNISNDGWFDGTEEHEQHLAICRFRAIETRRSVVRAVNMGISAIIDPDGRVVALPGPTWAESKKVAGIVRGAVPLDTRTTLYARLGDWLPVACWAVLLGGFARGFVLRRRAARARVAA